MPPLSRVRSVRLVASSAIAALVAIQLSAAVAAAVVAPSEVLPVAVDDQYSVMSDATLTQPAPGVLANDAFLADGKLADGKLTVRPFSPAVLGALLEADVSHGTLALAEDGSFTYTPEPGYFGADAFTYRACTGSENCSDPATAAITVIGHPPVAIDDALYVVPGSSASVDVLANDQAGSGVLRRDGLTLSAPAHGTAAADADGLVTYELAAAAAAAGVSSDTFTYTVSNTAGQSTTATVHVTIDRAPGIDAPQSGGAGVHRIVAGSLPPALSLVDPDTGDVATAVVTAGTAPGSLALRSDGTWTGSTAGAAPGTYTLVLSICDQRSYCTNEQYVIVVSAAAVSPGPSARITPPVTATSPTGGTPQDGAPLGAAILLATAASVLVLVSMPAMAKRAAALRRR